MPDKVTRQIADNLRQLRLQRGLTQVELARKAGINDNYYARLERAELSPTLEKFEKVVKTLQVKSSKVLPF
jgi:transcriptional regulator with XRE-family HTH domain